MARKKKEDILHIPAMSEASIVTSRQDIRDRNGLIKGIDYKFKGPFVDWRAAVNPQYVILNKYMYAKEGIDVLALSDEMQAKILADSPEEKKLIKLMGFREVAKLRGYISVRHSILHRDPTSVVACCEIEWLPNFETGWAPFNYSTVANATIENVDSDFRPFLETIACNRAFVRTVRESLGIPILGQDEIKNDDEVRVNKSPTPHRMLEDWMNANSYSFADILRGLANHGVEIKESYVSIETLPTPVVVTALDLIMKTQK